ncbi:DNA ligase D [Amycolatopsis sp. FDAARGOS 1241]|uniref:DNA ligase D n=1 Tax=Amycolatopsis sp. FDAARGOS 1241 TaxID=2778070 RepID=UPI0019501DF6|nr:DNA ligase D [Amycolatopsis sp. FDAARGOS 1241]QRP48438.1 DNA ligase D [Amycolatopsis sp. FDAARGOS 1241]
MVRAAAARVPAWVEPMLAKSDGGRLPSGPRWAYEYKVDGYRCCLRIAADGTTVLTSRNNIELTAEFAEIADVVTTAPDGEALVLDGEIVALDEHGRPDFEALQQRRGRYQTQRGSLRRNESLDDVPVRFLAFDLLRRGAKALLAEPYDERRRRLEDLPVLDPDRIAVVPACTFEQLAGDGRTPGDFLEQAAAAGMEGLIAKVRTGAYHPGARSDTWLKHPLLHTAEVVVCGWRPGQRGFAGTLGGLVLGAHDPDTGALEYVGDVGTGFSQATRASLQADLAKLERRAHPFATTPPREDVRGVRWAEPKLVGDVVYRTFTRGAGRLRHTAWRGLRADKKPADVVAPRPLHRSPAPPAPALSAAAGQRITVQAGDRQLVLSNLDKVLYPANGFTKGEVLNYYSRIAPVLLPHLAGRPVTFIRYPDGVDDGQWFEKNLPRGAPEWIRTAVLPSSGTRSGKGPRTITYPLLEDLPSLVWAANIAALELHIPQWTATADDRRTPPDRLVFDLDPGEGTTIVECCRVAERLREVLVADGLTPFAKTSGAKGMQLYCAISTDDPAAPSVYAKRLARQLAAQTPGRVTAVMAKAHRSGRVFIDWSQNNPHKTTIAPYSLRGRDLPTVSTPITWDEVRACRSPADLTFTADDVLPRVAEHGDLLAGLAQTRVDLPRQ